MIERRPTKAHSLQKIIELEIPIGTVIDVGVQMGTPELRTAMHDRKQLLIEPVVEWNDRIVATYGRSGVDFELINVAASDHDGEMRLETSSVGPGQPITHARLNAAARADQSRVVPVRTLDTLVAERPDLKRPFLLKLDVDGIELAILRGAAGILPDCSVVIIEANIKTFVERGNALSAAGFEFFDIVDLCYYDGRLRALDLVFLNARMVQERGLDMYKQAFDMTKWVNFL